MYGNLTVFDRMYNLITKKKDKIKMKCKYCNRMIFTLESAWAETGQCIYCYEAEERGKQQG